MDYLDAGTHKEVIAKLDYSAPKCHNCQGQMTKYDFQKESKIPYLECAGYKTFIRLRKRRFHCKACGKIALTETSLVKKNHQISTIVNQKITQKLIEKVLMTAIAESLSVSTSTVTRKLKEFKFKTDHNYLPEHMNWDEYGFKKGLMSFIAQDFDSRKIIAILDGRIQVTIRNHFLRFSRQVRSRVKVITMDMFSPYYDIARKLRFRISKLRLKQSPRLFHSQTLKSFSTAFTLCYYISKLRLKQSTGLFYSNISVEL